VPALNFLASVTISTKSIAQPMAATLTQRQRGVGGRPLGNSSRMSSTGIISSSQFQLLNQTINRSGTVGAGDNGARLSI
jgi:hypothetical protein